MKRLRFLLRLPLEAEGNVRLKPVDSLAAARQPVPTLWRSDETPQVSFEGHGVVLGIVFSRSTGRQVEAINTGKRTFESSQAAARYLLAHYWGAYCALFSCVSDESLAVMCDPSGLLPVYRFKAHRHILLGTDAEDFCRVETSRPSVSFDRVRGHLLRPELRQRQTCLTDIDEIVPGALVDPHDAATRGDRLWQVSDFLPQGSAPQFHDAACRLHDLAVAVHRSWSSVFGQVCVATSGGVDSSLVCAALADAGSNFDCVTVTTADRSGDERIYAQSIAQTFGVQCAERLYDPDIFDPCRSASTGLPRPARRAFLQVLDAVLTDAMDALGANAVFDGNGGDNLFCFLHSSAPILDRLRTEGFGRGSLATFLDMCRITGCSIPTMARALIRRMVRSGRSPAWADNATLLLAREDNAVPDPLTTWLDTSARRTGKRDHLALIMRAQNHIHGITMDLPRFSILASQPLLEFCLSIPTWIWAHGGLNRALARAAFETDLPPATLVRTSKSGPDSFIRMAFAANRSVIAERLLDGVLAQGGMLDRAAVEQALIADEVSDQTAIDRLLDLLEAENWCRSWIG